MDPHKNLPKILKGLMDLENRPNDRCLSLDQVNKAGGEGLYSTTDSHTRDATGYFQTEISIS